METTIYAMGDSITYGFPFGPNYSWVKRISDSLNINFINGGINGDTTTSMVRRLSQAISCHPSHLLLMGGVNDAYFFEPTARVGENYVNICSRCDENGIEVILGQPTPVDEPKTEALLTEYRSFLTILAKRENYHIIPFNEAFLDTKGHFISDLTVDGCHPNLEGYKAMAEVALRSLSGIKGIIHHC